MSGKSSAALASDLRADPDGWGLEFYLDVADRLENQAAQITVLQWFYDQLPQSTKNELKARRKILFAPGQNQGTGNPASPPFGGDWI